MKDLHNINLKENKVKSDYLKGLTSEKDFKVSNIFRRRPDGILIMDTFNNPFYPIKNIIFDTDKYDFKKYRDDLSREYGISKDRLFLPWHWHLEIHQMEYIIKISRPQTYRSLIPDYENYLVIMITGDTNTDIYNDKVYKSIAHFIINSLKYQTGWKIKSNEIKLMNIGKNFSENKLKMNLR